MPRCGDFNPPTPFLGPQDHFNYCESDAFFLDLDCIFATKLIVVKCVMFGLTLFFCQTIK